MTSTPRTYQISPEQKGRIIGALLLLPAFLHAVFTQCQIRNTWPVIQGLFVAGFLIAAMLLARAIVKRIGLYTTLAQFLSIPPETP
ncbi:hypothetical protein LBW46_05440 [Ralstonia solanacearum]|uniref:hypothetical protein n=1 Tax=Ralstonia solanacearum TaxID=305 RepID=UPI001CF359FA|nr:hypothetical protein [Ralstonia solanacearum]MDB0550501.1 hypothetical protein [Ralstonia solanacearum]